MSQLKVFTFNPIQVNTYLVYEPGGAGILIDPACASAREFDILEEFIRGNGIRVDYQLNTHGHFDHLFGVARVHGAFLPKFLIHPDDMPLVERAADQARGFGFPFEGMIPAPAEWLDDDRNITAGGLSLKVIATPGHSPGSVCFYEEAEGRLFSGDTLFAGGIGRTDLYGGNYDQLIQNIRTKLLVLPSHTVVYPGHGGSTTIKEERTMNPFLQ
jgi:hydroxyacylglutathione hydrolase